MNPCIDCGSAGHEDQKQNYPSGRTVAVIRPILNSDAGEMVPLGTLGKVFGHCDDGRAWIVFEKYGSHTFHFPEQHIALCHD